MVSILGFSQNLEILKKGQDVILSNTLKTLKLKKEFGSLETFYDGNQMYHKATTSVKPDGVYHLSAKISLQNQKVKQGQALLITFKARTTLASLETNEAKVNWLFKQTESAAPKDVVSKSVSLSDEWRTYYIPFSALFSGNLEDTTLAIQFGYAPQVFEIKDIQLLLFPENIKQSDLPRTKITYAGIESNAEWRIQAEKKIEEIRKGKFSIFFYYNNTPLQNSEVSIKQVKHHFNFGAAVNASDLISNPNYFATVKKYFNTIVFENDLKEKRWNNKKNQPTTLQAIKLLNENQIKVKGHVLLWPGFRYLPNFYEKNQKNPVAVKKQLNNHLKSILGVTKGKITHWDVINEVYTNKDIQTILGSDDVLFETFTKAKELDPNAKRYINEYGILSGGGTNTKKQDWYFNFIKEIDQKTNGAIDGLGMQSHIGTDLTPPTKVIKILNRFAALNKEISISEFTLDITDDEELRAQYTRDYMTAAFSNPAVKEFLFWGFYEPQNPKAALFDANFQLTPMGQSYQELVFKKWFTQLSKKTNDSGMVSDSGFYGSYEFTIKHDGKVFNGTFEILPNDSNKLKINLQ